MDIFCPSQDEEALTASRRSTRNIAHDCFTELRPEPARICADYVEPLLTDMSIVRQKESLAVP